MSSLNFAIAMGRLTGDPELKHTANDLAFTRFSIAVDRVGKSAEKQTDSSYDSSSDFSGSAFSNSDNNAFSDVDDDDDDDLPF